MSTPLFSTTLPRFASSTFAIFLSSSPSSLGHCLGRRSRVLRSSVVVLGPSFMAPSGLHACSRKHYIRTSSTTTTSRRNFHRFPSSASSPKIRGTHTSGTPAHESFRTHRVVPPPPSFFILPSYVPPLRFIFTFITVQPLFLPLPVSFFPPPYVVSL